MTELHINIKEAAAACIRAMGKAPAALLFIDGNTEWTYDESELSGIPVFHALHLECAYWGTQPDECPFVPVGKTDGEITMADRRRFAEAWVNPVSKRQ
jgi:hypothetical protein